MYGAPHVDDTVARVSLLSRPSPRTQSMKSRGPSARSPQLLPPTVSRLLFSALRYGYGASRAFGSNIVLNNLVGWAVTTGSFAASSSDGRAWRPLDAHVEDMAAHCAAVIAADRELVRSEAFNVGSTDANYLIRDLATVVADIVRAPRSASRRVLGRMGAATGSTSREGFARHHPRVAPEWNTSTGGAPALVRRGQPGCRRF